MKAHAAILKEAGQVAVEEVELRKLKEDELLIRVRACNLCTSEYGIYTGNRQAKFPYRFGHEWTWTVVETGMGVKAFRAGDFVGGIYEYDTDSAQAQLGCSSRAPRGSSSSRTWGSTAKARAMATRWRWPPDSSEGIRPPKPSSCTSCSSSVTFLSTSSRLLRRSRRP